MERSRQHRSFADIPVMLEGIQQSGEEGLEMAVLAQDLQESGDVSLDLDQTLAFVEQADRLRTSSFLDDLASLTAGDREEALALPAGFRSARLTDEQTQLFLLLQHRRRFHATLFDHRGYLVFDAELRDRIMEAIRCGRDEPAAPASLYPDDDAFDRWIDSSRHEW